MIWNPFRRAKLAQGAQPNDLAKLKFVIDLIEQLLSVQLVLRFENPRQAFSTLMTNRLPAGYVFGFHDACFQLYGLIDPNNRAAGLDLLAASYKRIFGEQAGFALLNFSLGWQTDHEFAVGRQSGAEDFVDFKKDGTPTLGLQRIVSAGFDAAMVERTLNNPP